MNTVFIFLADGFETVEALGTADVLRRGGVDVRLVAAGDEPFVVSSQKIAVGVDMMSDEVEMDGKDIMVFPGGMPGTRNLAANEGLMAAMKQHFAAGGVVAAICAAPGYVAGQLDDIEGREFTCFDGCEDLTLSKGAVLVKQPAVTSGNLITGRSAGYYVDFGLEILKYLKGAETAEKVRNAMFLDVE